MRGLKRAMNSCSDVIGLMVIMSDKHMRDLKRVTNSCGVVIALAMLMSYHIMVIGGKVIKSTPNKHINSRFHSGSDVSCDV